MPASTRANGQVVFIGDYLFPEGDAAAIRTLSLARICRDLGYTVTVIGKGRLRPEDYDPETGQHRIEGVGYVTMNPRPLTAWQRSRHPIQRMRQSGSALEALDLEGIRAVIINASGSARHLPFVRAFCRRRSIPLIGEICEWYDPRQFAHGRLDPAYAVFWAVFHWMVPGLRHLIVVSRLLESRFAGGGRQVIRIPPVLDTAQVSCVDRTRDDRLVLLYAGMPGRKDLLREFVAALGALTPGERARVEFRLLGPTKPELARLLGPDAGLLDTLGDVVKPLGRVPRDRVLDALQEADLTVLLRPDRTFANAGFPSKVPESLAAGVPVLLNFTSDLGGYLGDLTAAIEVRGCSRAEVAVALRRALRLDRDELARLRRGARMKAEQCFDYRLYLDPFARFLAAAGQ